MSWSDKEIDEVFREASNSMKTPIYQESFFDDIESLLPQQKSKKGLFWMIGGISSVLILVGIFVGFELTKSESNLISTNKKSVDSSENSLSNNNINSIEDSQISEISDIQKEKPNSILNNKSKIATESNLKPLVENTKNNKIGNSAAKSRFEYLADKTIETITEEEKLVWNDIETGTVVETNEKFISQIKDEIIISVKISSEKIVEERTFVGNLPYVSLANPVFLPNEILEVSALILPIKKKKHFLFLDLDFGFSESFVTTTPASRPMKTFALGAGYQYRNNGFAYEIGLNFMNYNPSELNLTRQSKVYGFEVNKYSQNIDYKLISTLELPIMISKRTKNHQFGIGISPTFVLGSVINFTKIENDVETVNERVYGNKLGLTNFGLKPQISYSLLLKNNFQIGAKISVNALNFLDESKFVGTTNQLPFQAQLSIRKNITLK